MSPIGICCRGQWPLCQPFFTTHLLIWLNDRYKQHLTWYDRSCWPPICGTTLVLSAILWKKVSYSDKKNGLTICRWPDIQIIVINSTTAKMTQILVYLELSSCLLITCHADASDLSDKTLNQKWFRIFACNCLNQVSLQNNGLNCQRQVTPQDRLVWDKSMNILSLFVFAKKLIAVGFC